MPKKSYYVYIMASKRNGTLYVGVTNNVIRRAHEHKTDMNRGFTSRYGVHRLVYFETFQSILAAIEREKRIKKWRRAWKIELIEQLNPAWRDLYGELASNA